MDEMIIRIPLEDLRPHPLNRRVGGFDQGKLEQLAASIASIGVREPAIVRPKSDAAEAYYEIVAGERRWRASQLAGVPDLPCIVQELDDVQALEIRTVENLQREDVHPLDEAAGYHELIETAGYSIEEVAAKLGKSPSYVYQRLKLLELDPDARKLFVDGAISAGHAILIARLQIANQKELVEWLVDRAEYDSQVSVRELAQHIQRSIMLDLAHAIFKKDDANLFPTAGPCTLCPKRTGANTTLFADVCKSDYCLDRGCYEKKVNALIGRRREEFAAKGLTPIEAAGAHADYRKEDEMRKAGILTRGSWRECKKKDEGAVPVLIVTGDEAGKTTWGQVYKDNRPEKSVEEKKRERDAREKEKRKAAGLRGQYDALVARASAVANETGTLPLELLRLIAGRMYARVDYNDRIRLAKMHGAERPPKENYANSYERPSEADVFAGEISKYDALQLLLLMVECLVISEVLSGWTYGKSALKEAMQSLGLSPEEILEEALLRYDASIAKKKSKKGRVEADEEGKSPSFEGQG